MIFSNNTLRDFLLLGIICLKCAVLQLWWGWGRGTTKNERQFSIEPSSLAPGKKSNLLRSPFVKYISNDFISPFFRQWIKCQPCDTGAFPECTSSLILRIPFHFNPRSGLICMWPLEKSRLKALFFFFFHACLSILVHIDL